MIKMIEKFNMINSIMINNHDYYIANGIGELIVFDSMPLISEMETV